MAFSHFLGAPRLPGACLTAVLELFPVWPFSEVSQSLAHSVPMFLQPASSGWRYRSEQAQWYRWAGTVWWGSHSGTGGGQFILSGCSFFFFFFSPHRKTLLESRENYQDMNEDKKKVQT